MRGLHLAVTVERGISPHGTAENYVVHKEERGKG